MHALRPITIGALVISSVCFACSLYVTSSRNWEPLELPFPGPGFEVADVFTITTSGLFRMEAVVPVHIDPNERALPELEPLNYKLMLEIDGPNGIKIEQDISSLRHSGRFYFGKVDYYESDALTLPSIGNYEFHLKNVGAAETCPNTGAMVRLTRFYRPTEFVLAAGIVEGLGWIALVVGAIGAFWLAIRSRKERKI
ncbi:MAG: hypothetical protein ACLPX9_02370 [Rhodomicrobium sp.]